MKRTREIFLSGADGPKAETCGVMDVASEAYELLALGMRYVFVLIGVVILFRAYRWMRRDARNYKREMKKLPDAGLVGELVELPSGKSHPLPWEGVMGAAASCDVRVKREGVAQRHALFAFEKGKGLRVTPYGKQTVWVDGQEAKGGGYALHGSQVTLGEAVLRVRFFAGVEAPHPVTYQPWEESDEAPAWEEEPEAGLTWEQDAPAPGFPMPGDLAAYEAEDAPWPEEDSPGEAPLPEPWPDAAPHLPLHETEMENAPWGAPVVPPEEFYPMPDMPAPEEEGPEALPYQSPLPRRRRRRRRE